ELYQVDKKQAKEIAWIFRKCSIQYLRLYPGVKKLLKNLKKEGYQIRLLSNAQEAFTIPELEKLKIKAYFDRIAISSMYGIKKPNQSFYKQALSDVDFSEAIMIGNEPECDIIPAQALGLKTIYIESNLTFKKNINPDVYGFDYKLIYQKIKKY
ncbi:MAG: HAD family hydrolase, partial [Anaeroplasmataceae bacterium]|nr:HAD family hydrolase [Anaeroplasmataceae bacterium]